MLWITLGVIRVSYSYNAKRKPGLKLGLFTEKMKHRFQRSYYLSNASKKCGKNSNPGLNPAQRLNGSELWYVKHFYIVKETIWFLIILRIKGTAKSKRTQHTTDISLILYIIFRAVKKAQKSKCFSCCD